MPTIAEQLTQLESDREDLVDNLEAKGITGLSGDETFTELVPEVLNIPSGGGGLDWSAIGYNEEPESIEEDYNYAKDIYDNWDSTITDLSNKFKDDKSLRIMPLVDTSNVTQTSSMFRGCYALTDIPLLNLSNVTNVDTMFRDCTSLVSVLSLNTPRIVTINSMFVGCLNLKDVPILDTSHLNGSSAFQSAFSGCPKLTDTSLDNILQMCIRATSYNGIKTIARLGFSATDYPASRIQALPHYQDFIDAGWTIGY